MINKAILIGNVGQDPEIRYTGDASNGTKVATLRLATTERYKDRNGNLQEHTEWHNIVVWRNTADVVEKYVVGSVAKREQASVVKTVGEFMEC